MSKVGSTKLGDTYKYTYWPYVRVILDPHDYKHAHIMMTMMMMMMMTTMMMMCIVVLVRLMAWPKELTNNIKVIFFMPHVFLRKHHAPT